MSLALSSLPLWLTALLIVALPTIAAMLCPPLVRRSIGLEQLTSFNEVAGFKFAVVGVTYAVLLGFVVIVVWEKFSDAEATVAHEAAAVVATERLSRGLDADVRNAVRERLSAYAKTVIENDWPLMARAELPSQSSRDLDALYDAVLALHPATPRESAILTELLTRLDAITEARRDRLLLATGIVPPVLWAVLVAGGVTTLSFTFFFGLRSVRAQTLMTGMLAAMIFMSLFIAIEIDHPFTGGVSVTPEAMELALAKIAGAP